MTRRLVILLLSLALWAPPAGAAVSYVNAWGNGVTIGTALPVDTSTAGQAGSGHPIVAGDGLYFGIQAWNSSITIACSGITGGSGTWTTEVAQFTQGTTSSLLVCAKVAVSGDVNATFTFSPNSSASAYMSGGIIALSGQTSLVDVAGAGNTGTSGALTALSITPTVSSDFLLWFGGNNSTGAIAQPTGFNPGFSITGTASLESALGGYEAYTGGTAATGNIASSTTSSQWEAVMIAVPPTGGATPSQAGWQMGE